MSRGCLIVSKMAIILNSSYVLTHWQECCVQVSALWCWKESLVFACIILLIIISIYGTLVPEEAVISTQSILIVCDLCGRSCCSRLFAFYHKHHMLLSCQVLPGKEVVLMGNFCSEFKLGNLQLFLIDLILGKFENISWEKMCFNWENWEHLCKILK